MRIVKPTRTEEAGIIQTFEFTFELGWETLKDLLEAEGYAPKTPRETIKQAFQISFITNGEMWLDALEKRNVLSHAYDEKKRKKPFCLSKNPMPRYAMHSMTF